jgi:hypothetical protein
MYNALWSSGGIVVDYDVYHNFGQQEKYGFEIGNREAVQVYLAQVTEKYAVQVLTYYKFGYNNMALRLIEHKGEVKKTASGEKGGKVTSKQLSDLMARYNKH